MLSCITVTKILGTRRALDGVTFASQPGDSLCIAGEGGAGKSLLMRLLLGLDRPTSGRIEVDGVDLQIVPPPVLQLYRAKVGTIFQEPRMLERMTLAENIAYPLAVRGSDDKSIALTVRTMLETVGLSGKGKLLPQELSPSERAMACIGRALITKPMIVMADEPLAHLDSEQSDIALKMLQEAKQRGASLILFSQGTSLAHRLDATVLQLVNGRFDNSMARSAQPQRAEPAPPTEKPKAVKAALEESPATKTDDAAEVPVKHHAKHKAPAKGAKGPKKIRITQIGS